MDRQYQPNKINYTLPIIGLDLGCGYLRYREDDGFIGVDIIDYGQEIVWDVRHGIPLPDNSVPEVFTCHFMEHLEWKELFEIFREVWRVCKNEAPVFIRMPYPAPEKLWALFASHKGIWDELVLEHFFRALNAENNDIKFKVDFIKRVGDELQSQAFVIKEEK
ncbi:class I SAM-dependent methyltransferase [Candidatus Woesearchaeota archaeon]|nr:class I SAM-dependent methyltransferase [Candidatus Woesearchaeota archaeon]